jgi:hypothetical protein
MSLLKLKNKKCIECGREDQPHFSKKRCKSCASKSYGKIKPVTNKSKAKRKEQSSIRDVYFEALIPLCKKSDESGVPIYNATRANICHIFPKRTYKSVQANLDNHIFLTIDEHTRFDYLLDTLNFEQLEKEFKNSWQKVLFRVKKLLPLTHENGKLKIKFEEYLKTNENENI